MKIKKHNKTHSKSRPTSKLSVLANDDQTADLIIPLPIQVALEKLYYIA